MNPYSIVIGNPEINIEYVIQRFKTVDGNAA